MDSTPNLALPLLETGQSQKEATHNAALNRLDVLVQAGVIDIQNDPPAGPVDGDAYIVGAVPTADWAGHAGAIAAYFAGWEFYTPAKGWRVFDRGGSAAYEFDGAAWVSAFKPGDWQVPGLNLGWIGLGGAWSNPRYRKARDGLVTIEGGMQHATASTDGVIFTLLAGFRPAADLIFIGYSAGGPCRWNIYANGNVEVAASNKFGTSFSGIQFYAA